MIRILGFRKGSVLDIIPIILIIFLLGVGTLVMTKVMNQAKVNLVDEGGLNSTVGRNIMTKNTADYSTIFDLVIPMIFVGLCIGMVVGAFMIRTYPVFFIVSILMLLIFILVVPVFSNAYDKVCTDLSTECASFTKTQYIFDYMPLILTVVGIVTMVSLYAVFKE